MNVVPPALCVLGAGLLAVGLVPRAASAVTYGFLAWALLVDLIGGSLDLNHWLLDTSVLHQMAPAPAAAPDWTSAAVMAAAGVAAALAGAAAFGRRDLAAE